MKVSQPDSIIKFIKSNQLTFVIPVYQRNYVWNATNCEKLFDDVLQGIYKDQKHYFGNVVYYIDGTDPFTGFTRYILIDGQQRITSTMLLLAAIRDEEENLERRDLLTKTYLINADAEEDFKVKLKQIENDRDVFENIIKSNFDGINKDSTIYKNYNKFRALVRNTKENGDLSSAQILQGIDYLNVIAIDLESNSANAESPQVIFESLNATGRPLSAADLLRNFLLLEVGIDKQENAYKEYWLAIEKNIPNDEISEYVRRYLIMRTRTDVKHDDEYNQFKKQYHKLFTDAENALLELRKFSKYYRWIRNPKTMFDDYRLGNENIGNDIKNIVNKLQELDELRLEPAASAFMWLLERGDLGNISWLEIEKTFDVIASWSFRARVTNIVSTGEVGTVLRNGLLEILNNYNANQPLSDYVLFELSNYNLRDIYPTDNMFKEAFVKYNFYKNYSKYVQRKLEIKARERFNNHDNFDIELESIEHVMPQTLDAQKWPNITQSEHIEWINTIGNLTPMNMKDNPAASNESFDKKKKFLSTSAWFLTKEVVESEDWGINEIKQRAEKLAKDAVKIWQGPLERTRNIELSFDRKNKAVSKILKWINEFNLPNVEVETAFPIRSIVRFSTKNIDTILPPAAEGGEWGNGKRYYYEIRTDKSGYAKIYLTVFAKNSTDAHKQIFEKMFEFGGEKSLPARWNSSACRTWNLDYSNDEAFKNDLKQALEIEIPKFEESLMKYLN